MKFKFELDGEQRAEAEQVMNDMMDDPDAIAYELVWHRHKLAELLEYELERERKRLDNIEEIEAKLKWNAEADEYNQWDNLGQDEKDELISKIVSTMKKI